MSENTARRSSLD